MKMTSLLLSVLLLCFVSCKEEKMNFDEYFNRIVENNLHNKYRGYIYGHLREGAFDIYFPDSTRVIFTKSGNKISKIRSVEIGKNFIDLDTLKNKTELENKINEILQELHQYHILILESREHYIDFSFSLEHFNPATLPKYQSKEQGKEGEEIRGVLIHYYTDPKGKDELTPKKIFEYYQPTPIKDRWYYYTYYTPAVE